MFVILWEFEVKPGSEHRFLSAYGPDGAWIRLFQSDSHFRGTQLRRDPARPLFYLTIDLWDSESAYNQFLQANQALYRELDHSGENLTLKERFILSFTIDLPDSVLS